MDDDPRSFNLYALVVKVSVCQFDLELNDLFSHAHYHSRL